MSKANLLPAGYEIREMSDTNFNLLWEEFAPQIFDKNSQIFRLYRFLSEDERSKMKSLGQMFGKPYRLNLGLFHEGSFVGWSAGHQESPETFYMRNSALLPEHRRKGLYTAMMVQSVERVSQMGFQSRKVLAFRVGEMKADDEIKNCFSERL